MAHLAGGQNGALRGRSKWRTSRQYILANCLSKIFSGNLI